MIKKDRILQNKPRIIQNDRILQDQMSWSIKVPKDKSGMTGRECPNEACLGYFKVKFGTGLKGKDVPCICPYCGHQGSHDTFWTQKQLDYAQSIAVREITGLFVKELKKSEFNIRGPFGMRLSEVDPNYWTTGERFLDRDIRSL